jgi:hypothetical protein
MAQFSTESTVAGRSASSTSRRQSAPSSTQRTCALCAGPASQQIATSAGHFSDIAATGTREWIQLPAIESCDNCLTLIIRERATVGWCEIGRHWGPEYAECQHHESWFDRPLA